MSCVWWWSPCGLWKDLPVTTSVPSKGCLLKPSVHVLGCGPMTCAAERELEGLLMSCVAGRVKDDFQAWGVSHLVEIGVT